MIPSLGKVQGVVAMEAMFQGTIKSNTAYVYRVSSRAKNTHDYPEEQIFNDQYAVILIHKNVKDEGGNESSDTNDELCAAIAKVLFGWTPPGCISPLKYERGEGTFSRNFWLWHEIYSTERIISDSFGEDLILDVFPAESGSEGIIVGMPIILNSDGTIRVATHEFYDVAGFVVSAASMGENAHYRTEGIVEREDWSEITGTKDLAVGSRYYLAAEGGMQNTEPTTGVVRPLGRAITERMFDIEISDFTLELL
jgi:hypothetical protein